MNHAERKKTNYHTHTTFSDGENTIEEIIQTAVNKHFSEIGFSDHAMFPLSAAGYIAEESYDACCAEIRRAAELYADRISVKLGFEADFLSAYTSPDKKRYSRFAPDYLIGSLHFLWDPEKSAAASAAPDANNIPRGFFAVDNTAEELAGGIASVFGGDGKKAVQTYFALEREMIKNYDFDIIGHIDLIKKLNSRVRFFDKTEAWYTRELEATAAAIAGTGKIVEINTGGMARGTVRETYPSADFLRILRKKNIPLIINADAHQAEKIDFAFDIALQTALEAGYRTEEIRESL
ncbi:MAG: histidinol-phosphatase [Bacteroides sp.]|nr:histidinol-phosphatase [Prevotella sp.]MCM1408247.1 histidinol-phosphatase [Treponema brennaborense]MCM1469571.1 histidinol-phosphatase [Bacteroides sp.]